MNNINGGAWFGKNADPYSENVILLITGVFFLKVNSLLKDKILYFKIVK